jgi:hypothetical protein
MNGSLCLLEDRGVIELTGEDTAGFLQRLITNSVRDIPSGEARFSALLTPQGKLLFDFIVVPLPQGPEAGYLFDCVRAHTGELIKRLNLHKMRAKIAITDRSGELGVAAVLAGEPPASLDGAVFFRDPRAPGMGWRMIAPHDALARLPNSGEEAYERHRIAQGVPKGGVDFAYGDAFVHDVNLDFLHGVDFKKGCYVGQEVVARVQFRKSARKRIVKVHFDGNAPAPGTPIIADGTPIGLTGSAAGAEGLAMVRIDRLEEARAAGAELKAGETPADLTVPPEFLETAAGVESRL